jgi:5-methylcytosine-specific restriction endonuclease McrA
MAQTTHKKQRTERHTVIRKLFIPFLTPKDAKRGFTDEEKRIIWDQSDKICGVCRRKVSSFEEYEPDHMKAHSKGGFTVINNAQVSHRSCNRAKNDS